MYTIKKGCAKMYTVCIVWRPGKGQQGQNISILRQQKTGNGVLVFT